MSTSKANPAVIGAFTLVGLLLATAAVILFGAGRLFKKTHDVMLYFDKSAYGLQVGSDVRFGGVRIGSVRSISVLIDSKNDRKIIPVVVELGQRELGQIGVEAEGGEFDDAVGPGADAGGFDVENDEGAVELDGEHGGLSGKAC